VATIKHISVAVINPKLVAENLAALTGGTSRPFSPLDGAYVCMWDNSWDGRYIEFYPSDCTISYKENGPGFSKVGEGVIYINATHVNLSAEKSLDEIIKIADQLKLKHRPRNEKNTYDIWLEEQFLVEISLEPG